MYEPYKLYISIADLKDLYKKIKERQRYDGTWINEDGSEEPEDVSYALSGIERFLEELEQTYAKLLAMAEGEDNSDLRDDISKGGTEKPVQVGSACSMLYD